MARKFAVFSQDAQGRMPHPTSLHEAAEYGNEAYITRMVERTLDLDINQRVGQLLCLATHLAIVQN